MSDRKSSKTSSKSALATTTSKKSHSETSSLRELYNEDEQFIKLTTVAVDSAGHQNGAIVGALLLFHRQKLKLLQPSVVLKNGALGVVTTAAALAQFDLEMKRFTEEETGSHSPEQTIASLAIEAGAGRSTSPLMLKLLLFNEQFFASLQTAQYPFPMRSSHEPFIVPELASRVMPPVTGGINQAAIGLSNTRMDKDKAA